MKRFKPAPMKQEYNELAQMILDTDEDVIEIEVEDSNKARILIFALKHRLLMEDIGRIYSFRTYENYSIVTVAKEKPTYPYTISEWTVKNLNDFGNSVVSTSEIKKVGGVDKAEMYLSNRIEKKVIIHQADSYVWTPPLYIAEIVDE